MDLVTDLLDQQDGVIGRRQALAAGLTATDVARRLRRREWVVVHPGVYVDHTGPLTWHQRAWAAVLACWPAALAGWSALRAHEGPGRRSHRDDGPIDVVVRHGRRPPRLDGVRARESRHFDATVQLNLHPPRQRHDHAVVELADRARDELTAVAVLAEACGSRRTTAGRLLAAVDAVPRLRRRAWLTAVLRDVAAGSCSVLEQAYLTRVERPHGLPLGARQVADTDSRGRRLYRDVVYAGARPPWRQVVELDGRLGHDSARERDRDLERDLDAALDGAGTIRLGWGQVVGRPCPTALKVARLLQDRGWSGAPTPCAARGCVVPDRQGLDQAG